METLPQEIKSDGSDPSRRLLLNMSRKPGAHFVVKTFEVYSNAFRSRTVMNEPPRLDQMFVPEVAEKIDAFLAQLSGETEVMSFPNFTLELPHTTLAGVQIVAKKKACGTLNLMFRFCAFLGSLNAVLTRDIGFSEDGIEEHADYVAVKALLDLALPLLNLGKMAEFATHDDAASVGGFSRNLARKAYEIEFQVELLKRFVEAKERHALQKSAAAVVTAAAENLGAQAPRALVNASG